MIPRHKKLLKSLGNIGLFISISTLCINSVLAADPWGRPKESFVNWENPHVHPLHITPDGSKLLAVNTPDNSLMVYDISGNSTRQIASIPVGLDPVSVRARTNNEVWVVNHVSDTISVVNLSKGQVIATLNTDDEPADVVFAGSPQKAFVSASQANELNVFDPTNLSASPKSIFINGEDPRALAVSKDGSQVYVAIFESGNGTTVVTGGKRNNWEIDLVRRPEGPYGGINLPPNDGANYKPPINTNIPAPPPVGMIVRKDNAGRWMDDNNGDWSRFISGDLSGLGGTRGGRVAGWDLPDRDVAIVNANSLAVSYQTRLMNANMAMAVNPSSGEVTVVGTDATNEIRWEPNVNGTFIRVNMARFLPGGANKISDLNPHLDYSVPTVPQPQRDLSIGDPRGIVWNPSGTRAYIAGMGSNNVIVIDNNGNRTGRIEVGEGPTGIALQTSTNRAFVLNKFDASISVLNLNNETESSRLSFFDPTPDGIKKGRKHLYDTHATSGLGQSSCASCHIDGRTDRLAWDLGNPAGEPTPLKGFNRLKTAVVEANQPPVKGPLLTMTLQDIIGHPSMHWSGDKPDLGHFASAFVSLQGDDAPQDAAGVAEFETFLDSIHIPGNPYRQPDNSYATNVQIPGPNGTVARVGNAALGSQEFETGCRSCHHGHSGRGDALRFNGGFGLGIALRPPTWRNFHERFGLWFDDATGSNSGFGFQQDGSFDSTHNESRSANMMAFMLSFNGRFPYKPAGLDEGNHSKDTHAAVGIQVMLNGNLSTTEAQQLSELFAMADDESIGLVVKGVVANESRGYAYIGQNRFQSDRESEVLTAAQLQQLGEAGNDLVYTAVPAGSEIRIGIDRDLDGEYDRDERDQISDASNQAETAGPAQCASSQNVARLGTATQSSTYGNNSYPASRAIDGNLTNFTHTAKGQSPASWELKLDKNYLVESIILHNRPTAQSRLRDITVYILDDSGEQPVFKSHFQNRHNRNGSPSKITLDLVAITGAPVDGRFIKIVRTPDPLLLATNGVGNADESDVLSLAEVEVMGCVAEVVQTGLPPVGNTDTVSVSAGSTITIDVLANDLGSGLTLTAPNAWSLKGGNVSLVNNKLVYKTKQGYAGSDNIWYVFSDSLGRTNSGQVNITVIGTGTNLALTGVAKQSSTSFGGAASRAIDNDTNGLWSAGSVTHTANRTNTWWEVDLAQSSDIQRIVLHNREDCCTSRLSNFTVSVLDASDGVVWSKLFAAVSSPSLSISPNVTGKKVRVSLNGTLSLAEVQVFGESSTIDFFPIATADNFTTARNTAKTLDILGNDSTSGGIAIDTLFSYSAKGGTTSRVNNKVLYTPKTGFTGEDNFWYVMIDSQGRTNSAKVVINVTP